MLPPSEIGAPTEAESRLARESAARLGAIVAKESCDALHVYAVTDHGIEIALPMPAVRVLMAALNEMALGYGVTLAPVQKELTTQQAADYLAVSRPFLIAELLDRGRIPYRKVGNRRRIRFGDLLVYQQEQETARRERVMLELAAETERLGLYK